MSELTESVLSIHRVETIDVRDKESKTIKPFESERQAEFYFDSESIRIAKHIILYQSMSKTKLYSTIELYQNDTLVKTVTIGVGGIQ